MGTPSIDRFVASLIQVCTGRPPLPPSSTAGGGVHAVGAAVGEAAGEALGEALGDALGAALGASVVGDALGAALGDTVVGDAIGETLGEAVVEIVWPAPQKQQSVQWLSL